MKKQKGSKAAELVFGELLSTRLHALAGISATVTTLRMRRKLNLTLLEWRAVGHLGSYGPLSLKQLAQRTGLDKSYASRTVTALVNKGAIVSERSEEDGRGVVLSLTEHGVKLFHEGMEDAHQRHDHLLSTLPESDREKLLSILGVLTTQAKSMLKEERAISGG
ncbi:MarR family winged helix-turn-helix transcriptional regulator [Ottowia thiooxydans]|uniref:MarR family winged helix-turn-helix transcriptional regulator n=1 Tax=Ottowia thiooxydans TaxID=219182 RepID=UPI000410288A|nr:MarR family transcriptional regulator [Ottowia thiooxydans]